MERINKSHVDLLAALKILPGKTCWSFIGGSGTGSMVSLDFGEKVPRKKPVGNPH
jgi:hypothetical protein